MQFRWNLQLMTKKLSHQYKRIQMYPMSMHRHLTSAECPPPLNQYISIMYIGSAWCSRFLLTFCLIIMLYWLLLTVLNSSVLKTSWIVCLWTNQCHLPCVETSDHNIILLTILSEHYMTFCERLDIRDISHDEGMYTSARKGIEVYNAPPLATWMYYLKGCHSWTVAHKLVNLLIHWLMVGMAMRANNNHISGSGFGR